MSKQRKRKRKNASPPSSGNRPSSNSTVISPTSTSSSDAWVQSHSNVESELYSLLQFIVQATAQLPLVHKGKLADNTLRGMLESTETQKHLKVALQSATPLGSNNTFSSAILGIIETEQAIKETLTILKQRLAPSGRAILIMKTEMDSILDSIQPDETLKLVKKDIVPKNDPQYIILQIRKRPRIPNVIFFPSQSHACAQIRVLGPMEFLRNRNQLRLTIANDPLDHTVLANACLLVTQRFSGLDVIRLCMAATKLGIPCALDIDDNFFTLPWFNPNAGVFDRFPFSFLLKAQLRASDKIIASTPPLAKTISQTNPNVCVAHNLVDTELFWPRQETQDAEKVIFGYIGTRTHSEDLRPAVAPLKKALLENPDTVEAVFVGHMPSAFKHIPNARFLGWYNNYHNAGNALAHSRINVALAPLLDMEFNYSKSAMKYLEYGACRIPCIFSNIVPYQGFVKHLHNGYMVNSHTEAAWEKAIQFIIENRQVREKMANNAYQDIIDNHSLQKHASEYVENFLNTQIANEPACASAPCAPPSLSAIIHIRGSLTKAIELISYFRKTLSADTEIIIIGTDVELQSIAQLGGDIIYILDCVVNHDQSAFSKAFETANSNMVLCIDQRCEITEFNINCLRASLDANTIAASPYIVELPLKKMVLHHQIPKDIVDEQLRLSGANSRKNSTSQPSSLQSFLPNECILLNKNLINNLGGIPKAHSFKHALNSIFEIAHYNNMKLVTHQQSSCKFNRYLEQPGYYCPPRGHVSMLVPTLNSSFTEQVIKETKYEPERILDILTQRLDIWIVVRSKSLYLEPCLNQILDEVDVPWTLNIIAPQDFISPQFLNKFHHRIYRVPSADFATAARLSKEHSQYFSLIIHDGVFVYRMALNEMLRVSITRNKAFVVPKSNDGSAFQQVHFGSSKAFKEIEESIVPEISMCSGKSQDIVSAGLFCLLINHANLSPKNLVLDYITPSGIKGYKNPFSLCEGAYVHVLSYPNGNHMVQWVPKSSPFYQSEALLRLLSSTDFMNNHQQSLLALKKLTQSIRMNPFDARVLTHSGNIIAKFAGLNKGMNLVENAKRVNPFFEREQ